MTASIAAALLVMLDPGHHPQAPGATSARGRAEYLFNEEIVRLVVAEVGALPGLRAGRTRPDGKTRSLGRRARQANREGAALLLSVHHDSVHAADLEAWEDGGLARAHSSAGRGFSLHVRGDSAESVRAARAIGRALVDAGFRPTLYHRPFHDLLDESLGIYDRRRLALLNAARVPAVLLECGFIIHRDEEEELSRPAVRSRLVKAVASGVAAALGRGGP